MHPTAFHLDPDLIHGALPAVSSLRLVARPLHFMPLALLREDFRPMLEPSRAEAAKIIGEVHDDDRLRERVCFTCGDGGRPCGYLERDGNGRDEPRTNACGWQTSGDAPEDCPAYEAAKQQWQQDAGEALAATAWELPA